MHLPGRKSGGASHKRGPAGPTNLMLADLKPGERRQVSKLIKAQVAELHDKHPPTPFRYRYQLTPLLWLAGMAAGLAAHAVHAYVAAAIGALIALAATVVATAGRSRFARAHCRWNAVWCAVWSLVFTATGPGWWAAIALWGWAVPYGFWVHRYRWRPPDPAAPPKVTVVDTWRELAETQRWWAWLGPPEPIPGGHRWPIICKGSHTHIGKIADHRDEVAAAFDKTVTTAYAEPSTDGVRSRGWLTILRESTLDTPRPWDGKGIDPETGLAVVGRFPEGGDLHEAYFVPGVGGGTRHTIIAGADGTGKTGMCDMGLCVSIKSGLIAPVILDPQMGQALPAWRDRIPYACGTDECMTWLRALYAAMMTRSEALASRPWRHPRTGKTRKGMGWFDPIVTGLPIIEITVDEAPILLAVPGAPQLLLDIAKLGRKVGFRLRLAAQIPSIAELGKGELRSILVGGNVFCFRTGDKVTSGMTNITARPNELPKFFADGTPTRGLGYADTINARPGVTMRTDWIEEERLYDFAETCEVRPFDPDVANAVTAAFGADSKRAAELAAAGDAAASREVQVLAALTGPMTAGQLITATGGLPVSQVVEAATRLEATGRLARRGDLLEPVP
jgi:hypothetical protein